MKRWKIRATIGAAIQALTVAALCGGVNQWTTHGPNVSVYHLAADPADPQTVYASGFQERGVYKSSDGGETWEKLALGNFPFFPFDHVSCLAVDPTQPTTIYAGTVSRRFLRSRDGGIQWEAELVGPAQPISIAVDTATGSIYLGNNLSDVVPDVIDPVLKSTDGGNNWSGTGFPQPHAIYALLADSFNQTVLAGTDFAYEGFYYFYGLGGNVARTSDGGASWSLPPTDLGSSVRALAMDPQGTPIYYAGTVSGALYRSFDGGANWGLLASLPAQVSALAVDPAAPAVLYAATYGRGVLRSNDGGASWRSFNSGMFSRNVSSLTIDSAGKILHVGTDQGVFDIEIEDSPEPGPCLPGTGHLCLFGSRFQVDLTAIDPFTNTVFPARGVPKDDRFGYFSFPTLTGDPTFPEVFLKMVDATSLPGGGYWVFYGGMTSVLYTLTITDTTTGVAREYSGEELCGGADVNGFLPGSAALETPSPLGAPGARLRASESDLALLSGRFRITLAARNPATDTEAAGLAIPQADRFGYFSLPAFTGDPELPEVFVKMIDATGGVFLFFHTGLTNLPYTLTIVDTVTGTERTYANNPVDPQRLCGGADVLIFPE